MQSKQGRNNLPGEKPYLIKMAERERLSWGIQTVPFQELLTAVAQVFIVTIRIL